MSDYTPTVDTLRDWYVEPQSQAEAINEDAYYRKANEFDRAIAQIRAEALRAAVDDLTDVVEGIQSSGSPNSLGWQTGALAMRDRLKTRADKLVTE